MCIYDEEVAVPLPSIVSSSVGPCSVDIKTPSPRHTLKQMYQYLHVSMFRQGGTDLLSSTVEQIL